MTLKGGRRLSSKHDIRIEFIKDDLPVIRALLVVLHIVGGDVHQMSVQGRYFGNVGGASCSLT